MMKSKGKHFKELSLRIETRGAGGCIGFGQPNPGCELGSGGQSDIEGST
jgi:hypothetical protein